VRVQVIELTAGESQNGCVSDDADDRVTCQATRRFDEPLRLHVAASDCHSERGLQLDYELDVFGVTNPDELCSSVPPSRRPPAVRTYTLAFAVTIVVVAVVGDRL